MSPRRDRIRKIVAIRQRELDERRTHLEQRRAAAQAAARQAEAERDKLRQAVERRAELARAELNAADFSDAQEWLLARSAGLETALVEASSAEREVDAARASLVEAHSKLKRLDKLDQRLASQETAEQERRQNRLHDELAANRFRRTRQS